MATTDRRLLAVCAIAMAATLALRWPSYADRLLDRDEAYWMVAARRMAEFHLPLYVAGWETKPPAVFLLHRAGLAVAPSAPLLGAHVLAALVAAATTALVALAGARKAGVPGAVLAGGLYALLDSSGMLRTLAAGCETLAALPVAALLALLVIPNARWKTEAVFAGVLVALAGLCKQPVLTYGPAAAVVLAVRHGVSGAWTRGVAAAALAGAACLTVIAATAAWLVVSGAGPDARICLVDIVGKRSEFASSVAATSAFAPLLRIAQGNAVLAAGALGALVFLVTGRPRAAIPGTRTDTALVVLALLAAGVGAALLGGMGFTHYWRMAYPPLALCGALGLLVATGARDRVPRVGFAVLVVLVASLAAIPDRLAQRRSLAWPGYDSPAALAAADAIRRVCPPGETVFVWGMNPDLYLYADRVCSSRFTACGWLVGSWRGDDVVTAAPMSPRAWPALLEDLERHPPRVVVDSATAGVHGFGRFPVESMPEIRPWLDRWYERAPDVAGYRFYVRR
jgi:hypothetical protein